MAESKEKTQSPDQSVPAASASADMKKEGQGGGKKGDKKKQKHASGDANKMQKEKPENPDKTTDGAVNQKSKADLKAERRALQEAQRAAKLAKKSEGGGMAAPKKEVRVPDTVKADVEDTQKKIAKKLEKQQIPQRTVTQRKVRLFNHLHQYEKDNALMQQISFTKGIIHPAIIKLGIQYAEGVISGSNARCVALLAALKKVIADYSTPPQKELSRDLEAKIKPYISFLSQCRLMSVSMGNAIKYLKWHITHIPRDMTDSEAKEKLCHRIDDFYQEKIELAGKAISEFARDKISDKDVIVVYACSSLIRKVMLDAHNQGRNFRVVVVDSRPRMEGRELLRRLVKAGIKCSYVLINAASYVMREATKVFLGAYALLANGYVMSRVGTSMLALIAKSCNVPVLVCCETYKFCERVQTDSFVFNELGDPDVVMDVGNKKTHLADWRDHQSLRLLNLLYDVTPPEFVTMVITEMGMIPCTSVPVVLRMKYAEISDS